MPANNDGAAPRRAGELDLGEDTASVPSYNPTGYQTPMAIPPPAAPSYDPTGYHTPMAIPAPNANTPAFGQMPAAPVTMGGVQPAPAMQTRGSAQWDEPWRQPQSYGPKPMQVQPEPQQWQAPQQQRQMQPQAFGNPRQAQAMAGQ